MLKEEWKAQKDPDDLFLGSVHHQDVARFGSISQRVAGVSAGFQDLAFHQAAWVLGSELALGKLPPWGAGAPSAWGS